MSMDIAQAVSIVARQLISNAAEEIDWEDIPEIGFYDWESVRKEIGRQARGPAGFSEAMALLEKRAEGVEA